MTEILIVLLSFTAAWQWQKARFIRKERDAARDALGELAGNLIVLRKPQSTEWPDEISEK